MKCSWSTQLCRCTQGKGDPFVVQKYIERPLLCKGGRKFDIRLWVLLSTDYKIGTVIASLVLFCALCTSSCVTTCRRLPRGCPSYHGSEVFYGWFERLVCTPKVYRCIMFDIKLLHEHCLIMPVHCSNHCIAIKHASYGEFEATNEMWYSHASVRRPTDSMKSNHADIKLPFAHRVRIGFRTLTRGSSKNMVNISDRNSREPKACTDARRLHVHLRKFIHGMRTGAEKSFWKTIFPRMGEIVVQTLLSVKDQVSCVNM